MSGEPLVFVDTTVLIYAFSSETSAQTEAAVHRLIVEDWLCFEYSGVAGVLRCDYEENGRVLLSEDLSATQVFGELRVEESFCGWGLSAGHPALRVPARTSGAVFESGEGGH